jgi:hypothetical protein
LNSSFQLSIFLFVEIFPLEKRLVAFKWYLGFFNRILRPGFFFVAKFGIAQKMFCKTRNILSEYSLFFEKKLSKGNKFEFAAFLFPVATAKVN